MKRKVDESLTPKAEGRCAGPTGCGAARSSPGLRTTMGRVCAGNRGMRVGVQPWNGRPADRRRSGASTIVRVRVRPRARPRMRLCWRARACV